MHKWILVIVILVIGFFSIHIINFFLKTKKLKTSIKNYILIFCLYILVGGITLSIVENSANILYITILPIFAIIMGLTNTSDIFENLENNSTKEYYNSNDSNEVKLKKMKRQLYLKALNLKQEDEKKEKIRKLTLKFLFTNEIFYKVFIVLQVLLIMVVIFYDLHNSSWDTINFFDNFGKSRHFIGNFLLIACVVLPIFISKSLDWILKKKENIK